MRLSLQLQTDWARGSPQTMSGSRSKPPTWPIPRLDPAQSNLDEQLKTLGSPALRFGGNALDRRLFWTSKGEKPKHGEKVTITPDDLKRLKKLVDATGSSVTIGIPLGDLRSETRSGHGRACGRHPR
jgi:hypothetical protein